MSGKIAALIMAAGSGERFDGAERKIFQPLLGRPTLVWSVERLGLVRGIDTLIVVCAAGDEKRTAEVLERHGVKRVSGIVAGGATRQESVKRGLAEVEGFCETVLVHDAARPCLTLSLIERILDALKASGAVVPVWPVTDTLFRAPGGRLETVIDRSQVFGAQTPQGFRVELLVRAHRNAEEKGIVSSDDGSLVLAVGENVSAVPGERTNVKITYIEDVPVAETILERQRL